MIRVERTIKLLFLMLFKGITLFALENEHQLIDVRTIDNIVVELRYATKNNFTGQQIYSTDKCYACDAVVQALSRVQEELAGYGLGLKIWDAYRPMSAQWSFWNLISDERYVSDPRKGGRHTRGTAVDLTLIDLKTGLELEMPTEFDDFTEKAWIDADDISDQARANRDFLIQLMKKHGFTVLPTEWWHFDYKNWEAYPVLEGVELQDL